MDSSGLKTGAIFLIWTVTRIVSRISSATCVSVSRINVSEWQVRLCYSSLTGAILKRAIEMRYTTLLHFVITTFKIVTHAHLLSVNTPDIVRRAHVGDLNFNPLRAEQRLRGL